MTTGGYRCSREYYSIMARLIMGLFLILLVSDSRYVHFGCGCDIEKRPTGHASLPLSCREDSFVSCIFMHLESMRSALPVTNVLCFGRDSGPKDDCRDPYLEFRSLQ